jgi:D-glycero-alpha-D-manno-heptose-7-phosphate kinase
MIYSSAPLRVSFAGGGTDYKEFIEKHPGICVGVGLSKRVHIFINDLSELSDEKIRFTYRKTESVNNLELINHPVVREVLRFFGVGAGVNIATMADLPGKTGLGSSSAFTVALIAGISRFIGHELEPNEVAQIAVKVERQILKEPGGLQDQYMSTFGGLRSYTFYPDQVIVSEDYLSNDLKFKLDASMALSPIGPLRLSSSGAEKTTSAINDRKGFETLLKNFDIAQTLSQELTGQTNIVDSLILAINENWKLKKIFQGIENQKLHKSIKDISDLGSNASKICGAGESGFILTVLSEPSLFEKLQNLKIQSMLPGVNSEGVKVIRI